MWLALLPFSSLVHNCTHRLEEKTRRPKREQKEQMLRCRKLSEALVQTCRAQQMWEWGWEETQTRGEGRAAVQVCHLKSVTRDLLKLSSSSPPLLSPLLPPPSSPLPLSSVFGDSSSLDVIAVLFAPFPEYSGLSFTQALQRGLPYPPMASPSSHYPALTLSMGTKTT